MSTAVSVATVSKDDYDDDFWVNDDDGIYYLYT